MSCTKNNSIKLSKTNFIGKHASSDKTKDYQAILAGYKGYKDFIRINQKKIDQLSIKNSDQSLIPEKLFSSSTTNNLIQQINPILMDENGLFKALYIAYYAENTLRLEILYDDDSLDNTSENKTDLRKSYRNFTWKRFQDLNQIDKNTQLNKGGIIKAILDYAKGGLILYQIGRLDNYILGVTRNQKYMVDKFDNDMDKIRLVFEKIENL